MRRRKSATSSFLQQLFDRRPELVGIERLRHEVGGTGREDVLAGLVPGGDHQHGHVAKLLVRLQVSENLQASQPRQHEVQDDDVRLDLPRQLDCEQPVACLSEAIAVAERGAHEFAERGLVVADEDCLACFHGQPNLEFWNRILFRRRMNGAVDRPALTIALSEDIGEILAR
jgi:hypothetical protein